MTEEPPLGRPKVIQAIETSLYTAKLGRNIILVLLSLYVSGSYLFGKYTISTILMFLQEDLVIALFAVLLGILLIIENSARLLMYSRTDPDDPRIALGIILSFTALGFGLALIRIWLPVVRGVIYRLA